MHQIQEKIRLWLDPVTVEHDAIRQLINTSELPFVEGIAVMPDCHVGKGATVGSVIAYSGAISPAAVGVDIGCGMVGVKTKFFAHQLPDNLESVRDGIMRRVPVSAGGYQNEIKKHLELNLKTLKKIAAVDYDAVDSRWPIQMGTLGGGNHFIEICLDENNQVWAVLHSGSRGIGNRIGNLHIKTAQKLMDEYGVELKDRDLAYLTEGTAEFKNYIRDLLWAQEFARLNRETMMDQVMTELSFTLYGENGHQKEIETDRINCHHNFTQQEEHFEKKLWITRKGAIQMKKGQRGIIPGSMGSKTYIVSGLENPLAYHSAPHGAGRRFSRAEAKRRFTEDDLRESMKGIVYRHNPGLVDEIIGAYKNIDEVMENSKDLVRVEHILRQVVNVKGN